MVDHSFHQKSISSFFLIDLLKKHFEVKIIWDYAWEGGEGADLGEIDNQECEIVILYQQIFFPESDLKKIEGKNLILIPMYDSSGGRSDEFWRRYKNFKIISFSKYFHEKLQKIGLVSRYFQYFPPVKQFKISNPIGGGLSGFFWQRTSKITWDHIRILIEQSDFKKFHIHTAVDPPGYPLVIPSNTEIKIYNITLSNWFSESNEYFKVINDANIYFTPRLNEGIGMSFLEAMAKGMCVVAPDNPTMNEYIVHGKTGLLYDPRNPKPLDFSNYQDICNNSREYIKKNYKVWVKNKRDIIKFIKTPIQNAV